MTPERIKYLRTFPRNTPELETGYTIIKECLDEIERLRQENACHIVRYKEQIKADEYLTEYFNQKLSRCKDALEYCRQADWYGCPSGGNDEIGEHADRCLKEVFGD